MKFCAVSAAVKGSIWPRGRWGHSLSSFQCCYCSWLCRDCITDVTCALTSRCCTSLVVSSHENLKPNSHSSQRFICRVLTVFYFKLLFVLLHLLISLLFVFFFFQKYYYVNLSFSFFQQVSFFKTFFVIVWTSFTFWTFFVIFENFVHCVDFFLKQNKGLTLFFVFSNFFLIFKSFGNCGLFVNIFLVHFSKCFTSLLLYFFLFHLFLNPIFSYLFTIHFLLICHFLLFYHFFVNVFSVNQNCFNSFFEHLKMCFWSLFWLFLFLFSKKFWFTFFSLLPFFPFFLFFHILFLLFIKNCLTLFWNLVVFLFKTFCLLKLTKI